MHQVSQLQGSALGDDCRTNQRYVDPQVTDKPGATEEDIRAEVLRVIDTLGKGGGLLASSAVMFSTVQGVDAIIDDEGKKYGNYNTLKFD